MVARLYSNSSGGSDFFKYPMLLQGQDNPLPTDKAAKFYEVTKQIVLTNHLVDGIVLMTNDQTWNSLTPAQQQAFDGATLAAIKYNNTNRIKDEQDLVAFFKSKGLEVYSPDVAAFRNHVQAQYLNTDASADWPEGVLDKINALGN